MIKLVILVFLLIVPLSLINIDTRRDQKIKDYYNLRDLKFLAKKISRGCSEREIITLSGPLGVGKSTFAKFFIQSFLKEDLDVSSPTYTLIERYKIPLKPEVCHMDFYRLESNSNLEDLDLHDAFENCISIIEWPDKLNHAIPKKRINLSFDFVPNNEDIRKVILF